MTSNMDAPLSAYWVKFFKAAGFSPDVATRHAVVFSNNRIQPDMLPDLDKPSLKDMGITLMGDMIAILRYAKKVVEETTCERFLVDSKDLVPSSKTQTSSTLPTKKVITKVNNKTVTPKTTNVPVKKVASKTMVVKKKLVPVRSINQSIEKTKQIAIKRKLTMDTIEIESDVDEDNYLSNDSRKQIKVSTDDNVGYKVIMPKGTTVRSQTILKKSMDQKRTVFDRLGDSSVTSTTSSDGSTTFNITGLGKSVVKRTNNVFNRLGDKDLKKDQSYTGSNNDDILPSHGILKKNKGLSVVSTTISNKVIKTSAGTMRADFERKKPLVSMGVKKLVTSTKLASERSKPISAKQRLGLSKQVTFNKIATIAHVRKPDVFSRLGI